MSDNYYALCASILANKSPEAALREFGLLMSLGGPVKQSCHTLRKSRRREA